MKKHLFILLLFSIAMGIGNVLHAQDEPLPTEFISGTEPQPINMDELKSAIAYPREAWEAKIEGRVVVRVLVDLEGNAVKYVVLKDPHTLLTNAVTSRILMLKFTPCIQDGKRVKMWVTIPFDFRGSGSRSYRPLTKYTISLLAVTPVAGHTDCKRQKAPSTKELKDRIESMYMKGLPVIGEMERTVTMEMHVSASGSTERVEIVQTTGDGFEEAVRGHLLGMVWKPAVACGEKIPSTVNITLKFEK